MAESLTNDFDAWARLSARLLRRSTLECARIIRDAGADDEWRRADAHWYGVLLDDVEAGRSDRLDKYRLICVEAMGARRRSGDVVPSPLDVLRPPEPPVDPVPAFATPFGSQRLSKPSPAQRATAMRLEGKLGADAARQQAARWSVEDYAWLCAELERYPEREDQVWGARGITTGTAQREVQRVWDGRLDDEAGLRSRYDELLRTYREMLRRR